MEYTHVLLVDQNDQPIGEEEKLAAHQKGLLHRAFSIVVYRQGHQGVEVLLQKRASEKYHCAGQWSNTCCSHPQANQPMESCLTSRLKFEMGITGQQFHFAEKFIYKQPCKGGLTEHEVDHVYLAPFQPSAINPNPNEVEDYTWQPLTKLLDDIPQNPQNYTPWLLDVMKITFNHLQKNNQLKTA
ncbi:MAG: isopentenyl-diphosphate delta-isomerase [Magnetococcales bacterium]|nr:isopentenyl-diphosphate delta-isomerase [Magnetococcales bacterium]|tara:strand:- start:8730 stop:9284 length:555 start_codon:yes stop_codon:yes gene_type:complete